MDLMQEEGSRSYLMPRCTSLDEANKTSKTVVGSDVAHYLQNHHDQWYFLPRWIETKHMETFLIRAKYLGSNQSAQGPNPGQSVGMYKMWCNLYKR